MVWDLGKFGLFNILLCLLDVITDIYAAVSYFRPKYALKTMVHNKHILIVISSFGDIYYGSFTLLFVFLPFLYSFAKDVFLIIRHKKPLEIGSFESFYHLPILQLVKHYEFLMKLNEIHGKMNELKDFESQIFQMIEKGFDVETNIDDMIWFDFVQKLKKMHGNQQSKRKFSYHLWKDFAHVHPLKEMKDYKEDLVKKWIQERKLKLNKEKADLQTVIIEFKLIEILFESFPQFLLQLSILIYEDPLFQNEDSITFVRLLLLITSLLSVVIVITSTHLNMPYYMENIYTIGLQKELKFQCWKNWIVVLPIIFLVSTPRLILMGIEFAFCTGQSAVFIPLVLICYSMLYWMVKQNHHL